MRTREVESTGPADTEALGEALGRAAAGGELIGLTGDLGSGKTCLVRGIARGLGADPDLVHSPTFVIATEYRGGRLPLAHVDLYRLESPGTDALSLRDVLYGEGVAAVEWFERLPPAAGEEALLVTLRHGGGDRRTIRLEAHGPRHERLLAAALGT
ncbi:MAG TPA: tRNA (adenosine(37)-N6)-threonylcarbamoyltransferase complex ATPase subunit type 1 TsaE [Candidatus Binatia bacterium]|nr:tRNA (adenosine(37)-N6)-threonylcarbamoyltransferase complex ATPase subunit type 1 TsaE [Candidatus Binatia bacterium]